jgi:hypothetical protein
MSHRKLQKIASSPALRDWALGCPSDLFVGTARVETQHATYLFRNGSCFAVSGRGSRGGTTSADLVGMKIAGWLLPETDGRADDDSGKRVAAGAIHVSRAWHSGARAVLYGKAGMLGGMRLALTSPVDAFTLFGESGEVMRPPSFDRSPTGSQTRVGVPIRAIG